MRCLEFAVSNMRPVFAFPLPARPPASIPCLVLLTPPSDPPPCFLCAFFPPISLTSTSLPSHILGPYYFSSPVAGAREADEEQNPGPEVVTDDSWTNIFRAE